jgi:hypothetical protein
VNCNVQLQHVSGPLCGDGLCDYQNCSSARYANCNTLRTDGCEEDLWQITDCRTGCGTGANCQVTVQNADGVACNQGACDYSSCVQNWDSCDGSRTNGCERNINTDTNCGACGRACQTNTGTSSNTCSNQVCQPNCVLHWASCDGDPVDGCEVNTWTDRQNCGSCGHVCGAGEMCVSGECNSN